MLYSTGNISEFNAIFDTQIAHRMCYEDENNCISNGTKNNSISYNELLKINFGVNVEIKDEVHELMSKSPYLWKTRPIPYKLNYYAGNDVYYLPKLYDIFCQKIESGIVRNVSIQDIFRECRKYLNYLNINKNIKNYTKTNLTEGTKIKGLIKNVQNHCVYIQLNIGYIGIIDVFPSVQILTEKYKLGDIVDFTIIKVDNNKKRIMLDLAEGKNEIDLNIQNTEDINSLSNINNKNNINTPNLVHGLNINKESFFPKSYNRNNNTNNYINYNNYDNNSFNNYPSSNYSNKNTNYNYYNNNYENYYKENERKKEYNNYNNNKNYLMNNEMIFNNNYNGLFYDYEGKFYYYNNNDDANNEDNEDENANSYYYTLKPFPK